MWSRSKQKTTRVTFIRWLWLLNRLKKWWMFEEILGFSLQIPLAREGWYFWLFNASTSYNRVNSDTSEIFIILSIRSYSFVFTSLKNNPDSFWSSQIRQTTVRRTWILKLFLLKYTAKRGSAKIIYLLKFSFALPAIQSGTLSGAAFKDTGWCHCQNISTRWLNRTTIRGLFQLLIMVNSLSLYIMS